MASITSLGLHSPSALPSLVGESILPQDPSENSYTWTTTESRGDDNVGEEELLVTHDCVVWSQSGIVRRTFRFDVEHEKVRQAVLTHFPTQERQRPAVFNPASNVAGSHLPAGGVGQHAASIYPTKARPKKSYANRVEGQAKDDGADDVTKARPGMARALVVLLQTQAHIYFLTGTSHVIHLPFEVESVLPAPHGLIIQRKLPSNLPPTVSATVPGVPQNTFRSSQDQPRTQPLPPAEAFSAGLDMPIAPFMKGGLPKLGKSTASRGDDGQNLPRSFSLTDPLVEMGLIVTSATQKPPSARGGREKASTSPGNLPPAEDMLYISTSTEISLPSSPQARVVPFHVALTMNRQTRKYTVWKVSYLEPESASAIAQRTALPSGATSRRRSSFGGGTGAATPAAYAVNGARESFGGPPSRGPSLMGPNDPLLTSKPRLDDPMDDPEDALATSLNVELDYQKAGPPTKQSRRVSSLLARADLSTNKDRVAFSDLAIGHAPTGTTQAGGKRGESLGHYNNRASLGANRNSIRRGSMPLSSSQASSSRGSFYDPPVDDLLEELNAGGDFEGFEGMGLQDAVEGLRKEVLMEKIESVPYEELTVTEAPEESPRRPKIFTFLPPPSDQDLAGQGMAFVMCIANRIDKTLTILTFHVDITRKRFKTSLAGGSDVVHHVLAPTLTDVWRGTRILDAVRLVDRDISRILVLAETDDGYGELTLRGPWDYLMRIHLPPKLVVFDPYHLDHASRQSSKREGSLKRVFSKGPRSLHALEHSAPGGLVDVRDDEGKRHRIRIQLQASNAEVAKILDVCRYVLPGKEPSGEGVLLGWWEVLRWLRSRPETTEGDEWTALVIVLMVMAVEFHHNKPSRASSTPKKRSGGLFRSSSGANTDMECWNKMLVDDAQSGSPFSNWMTNPGWSWILEEEGTEVLGPNQPSPPKSRTPPSRASRNSLTPLSTNNSFTKKNTYLVDCAAMAREFLSSPAGKAAVGKQGYLPTAKSKHVGFRRTALATILIGLHLFREELKLDTTVADASDGPESRLLPVLAQIGGWLGWADWSWREPGHYHTEDVSMDRWVFDESKITGLETPDQPFEPPSIYDWLCKSTEPQHSSRFKTLKDIVSPGQADGGDRSKALENDHWRKLTPRTPVIIALFIYMSAASRSSHQVVEKMFELGVNRQLLDTLPEGIAAPLCEAILECQARPPTTWGEEILTLIGRDDLRMLLRPDEGKKDSSRLTRPPAQEAVRDVHHICNSTTETEPIGPIDGAAEIDRLTITRLIFRDDHRFLEANKLVQSSRTSVAQCVPEPEWSDTDLLDAQKELAQTVALRTLAVPAGRGVMYFSARIPLLTERFPISGFNLTCVMKPSGNTVSADKSAFTEEKVGWAFFHAGVAAGLSISRDAKGIDTSWIVFNKPVDLSNRHAGFLLALGLNGHLKSIAKWVAFKYLTPKHTMTSIGLLLGLSASYLGTMDTLITKLLSVHVSRMLPPGAAELNLSPLTQTTGIMGIGLLYCDTQHRRMSEVMLSEIEHIDYDDSSTPVDALRDEGYRLAAGFALGYINLAKGRDLKGLHDMHLVERLLAIAVGPKKVSIVHVLDKSTAAATIAIALVFMRTHNEALARKIDIPDTLLQFDYVRPDIFLLRTLARHLIMWDHIRPTPEWIIASLPVEYQSLSTLSSISTLSSHDLPLYNILAGLCFAIALRYAGSASPPVRGLLTSYLDQYMRLTRLPARSYDSKLTRATVRNHQDLLALCSAIVMAGTGDLTVFRRLRSLHGRCDAETPFGSHLAAHLAIGVLFLGGGNFTFGTTPLATASLLCAFYPLFPNSILDNKSHLQAFRHFWVLAAEARCIVARDVDSYRPVSIPLSLTLKDAPSAPLSLTSPCLLPPIDTILSLTTTSPHHWRIILDFAHNPAHRLAFAKNQTILVRQHYSPQQQQQQTGADSASNRADAKSKTFRTTLAALTSAPASSMTSTPGTSTQPLASLLLLPPFATILSLPERTTLLPPSTEINSLAPLANLGTESTAVDARLLFEAASRVGATRKKDRVWGLKCLFLFDERRRQQLRGADGSAGADEGEGEADGRWIAGDVVDRLRTRVWLGCQDQDDAA